MTPTPLRKKEQGTPDTAAESPEPLPPPMDIAQLYRLLDTQIRVNIGTSVKCGICLSTLQSPTRTPCGHAFCKSCILASLRAIPKCPECNTKITKRALQPAHEQLQQLATLYKQSLVEFGFVPGVYQAGFTTLTQKPPHDPDGSDDDDSDNDNDQPDSEKDRGNSDKDKKQLALDRLHVAATWQHHSVPTTKIQKEENALVVQANTKACEVAGWVVGQPPTTQDILDQAREQQVADTALEDSFQDQSPSPPSHGRRRVSFEPVTTRHKRSISKPSSTTASPFLAPSLSPIAQEGSQRSETEPMDDCKPSAVAVGVVQPADAEVAFGMSPTPDETDPVAKVAGTGKPANVVDPTRSTESKWQGKEPSSTFGSSRSRKSKSLDKESSGKSDSFVSTSSPTDKIQASLNAEVPGVVEDSFGKEPTSTSGPFRSIIESKSEGNESTAKSFSFVSTVSPTKKTQTSPKAEVSGVVEDSFGALHWTNKSNISLTLSPLDEPEDPPLSLTLNYEEPASNHRHQKMEDDHEKKEPEPAKLDLFNLAEDSDATVPMSTDTIGDALEQEVDTKPAAATFSRRRANSEPSFTITPAFVIGDIVNVQSRTWSGINKPGGVARITKINPDHTYNVAYVLGGKESNVDSVFVTATEDTDKRRRRETTLPVSLLQALEAQGFDTSGQRTLEPILLVARPEKEASSRKQNRKAPLQDLSNRQIESLTKDEDEKPPPKKAKLSKSSSRPLRNSTTNGTTGEVPARKPTKKRNWPIFAQSKSSTDEIANKKQTSKRSKTVKANSDTRHAVEVQGICTEETTRTTPKTSHRRTPKCDSRAGDTLSTEKSPRVSTAVSVLEALKAAGTLPNDDVCKLADDHYRESFEAALKEKVIHVVASGLSEVDMDILKTLSSKSLANDVRIKVEDKITKKTTLCITPLEVDASTGNSTTLLRTVKVMRASLAGIPIVSPTWLYECGQQGKAISLSPQLLARSLPTKADPASLCGDAKYGVARMAVLLAQKAPLPLNNHFIFFCGAFEGSHRKDLHLLAREAGAKVLTNASAVTKKLSKAKVVLVCHDVPTTGTVIPPSLLEAVRTSLSTHSTTTRVINSQWIFESVTCAKVLAFKAFAPVNVKARELWQMGQES